MTITIDEEIYQELQNQVGEDHISDFIEDLIRPRLVGDQELEGGYQAMVADEGLIGQPLP